MDRPVDLEYQKLLFQVFGRCFGLEVNLRRSRILEVNAGVGGLKSLEIFMDRKIV